MLASTSERTLRIVRYSLLIGWLGLLASCLVDFGQSRITDPNDS